MSPRRLVRVEVDGGARWGELRDGEVHDLRDGPFGDPAGRRGAPLGELSRLRLLAPAAPSKIVCVARNYAAHAAEHAVEVPATPLLFLKPPSAVIGPGDAIVLPPESERVEHEAELALVIGRRCRRIDEAAAWSAVLGVTCANDVSARDLQRAEKLWTRGKGFDTFCPLGPVVVAGLAAEAIADLEVACTVNGELRQRGRTSEMVFSAAALVSFASQFMTLVPGDVLLTGTPAGVGPLTPGDEVIVEIEGVGSLTNPVRAEVG
ncbi:MAG: fumarylacetoacetate hydrolase family protein [Thermoanaerobaculales bacterium]|jgi:2-keto-4-pentenoate hydratase/2-oxohepta-3-ene-1,7-dioic acid hydratase in catechol pathway|nr:fumarylacetoacetate hydrolase family protein [Thermoanaerobaculales bacterium]